jgi:hypothetical protein
MNIDAIRAAADRALARLALAPTGWATALQTLRALAAADACRDIARDASAGAARVAP